MHESFHWGGAITTRIAGSLRLPAALVPSSARGDDSDLSRQIWRRKRKALSRVPPGRLQIVADSEWLASQARMSSLFSEFPVSCIHYSLDVDEFAPRDRLAARSLLGVPADAKVVLFVADYVNERRKGFGVLVEALTNLPKSSEPFLLSMGGGTVPIEVPFPASASGTGVQRPFSVHCLQCG